MVISIWKPVAVGVRVPKVGFKAAPKLTEKLCWTCGAALKAEAPAWFALSKHAPWALKDTTPELIEQIAEEPPSIVIATLWPEDEVAVGV